MISWKKEHSLPTRKCRNVGPLDTILSNHGLPWRFRSRNLAMSQPMRPTTWTHRTAGSFRCWIYGPDSDIPMVSYLNMVWNMEYGIWIPIFLMVIPMVSKRENGEPCFFFVWLEFVVGIWPGDEEQPPECADFWSKHNRKPAGNRILEESKHRNRKEFSELKSFKRLIYDNFSWTLNWFMTITHKDGYPFFRPWKLHERSEKPWCRL